MSDLKQSAKFDDHNLTKRWTQVLRASNKTTPNITCPLCSHRPISHSDDELWAHVLQEHENEVPNEGSAAIDEFRKKITLDSRNYKSQRQSNVAKPGGGSPRTIKSASTQRKYEATSDTPRPTSATSITVAKLSDLQKSQIENEPQSDNRIVPEILGSGNNPYISVEESPRKKLAVGQGKSPTSSIITSGSQDSPRRSKAKPALPKALPTKTTNAQSTATQGFVGRGFQHSRPPTTGKRLFDPGADSPIANQPQASSNATRSQQQKSRKSQQYASQIQSNTPAHIQQPASGHQRGILPVSILKAKPTSSQILKDSNPSNSNPSPSEIVSQPETRPITQEQLAAEVQGIYAGLIMVEGKCIQVQSKQAQIARDAPPGTQLKLNNEQWQALIALHRTLLHEHHDFLLASQHPSTTPAVRRLAIKYAMPSRLWRHGIQSFLELLRNRLPGSLEHMLAFIYLAYSMMTLLYETVPAFQEIWIECLGDIARYRMAIEDRSIRDIELWTQVARRWYLMAANRSIGTGRLYHHLAILARSDALPQLFYYGKALSVAVPFPVAKESLMALFKPALNEKPARRRFAPVVTAYIKAQAIIVTHTNFESFDETLSEFESLLDGHISRVTGLYLEQGQGYHIGISNCIALLGYGSSQNPLSIALNKKFLVGARQSTPTGPNPLEVSNNAIAFADALRLFNLTAGVHLSRGGDPNVLSFLHVTLVFINYVSRFEDGMKLLEPDFPWQSLVSMLNALILIYGKYQIVNDDYTHRSAEDEQRKYQIIEGNDIPRPEDDKFRPFPEEWALQGLPWAENYFPKGWFINEDLESEKHYMEDKSMTRDYRPERVLWLGCQLAKSGTWITYSSEHHRFSVPGIEPSPVLEPDMASLEADLKLFAAERETEMNRITSLSTEDLADTLDPERVMETQGVNKQKEAATASDEPMLMTELSQSPRSEEKELLDPAAQDG